MRIYNGLKEAAREIERDLFEMGIDTQSTTHQNHNVNNIADFQSKELMGYTYSVPIKMDMEDQLSTLKYMGKNPSKSMEYCFSEVADRIKGQDNPGQSFKIFPDVWIPFLNADLEFDYTYYERFHKDNQWAKTIDELVSNLESRRAIIQIYDISKDTIHRQETKRIPCSMHYQFMVRMIGGKRVLNIIYVMRSCDFYEHWIHDIIMAAEIARIMAINVERMSGIHIGVGNVIHQIGSLHMFKKDYINKDIF